MELHHRSRRRHDPPIRFQERAQARLAALELLADQRLTGMSRAELAALRAGSGLAEVGQVLRHRSSLSTAIYAKVDRDALAVLARPWPTQPSGGLS
jgi:hypothetical protein